jgi:hypothetical protein
MAVALPATAAWVGAVGTTAESVPEHAALGVVGFYAITVLTNKDGIAYNFRKELYKTPA